MFSKTSKLALNFLNKALKEICKNSQVKKLVYSTDRLDKMILICASFLKILENPRWKTPGILRFS